MILRNIIIVIFVLIIPSKLLSQNCTVTMALFNITSDCCSDCPSANDTGMKDAIRKKMEKALNNLIKHLNEFMVNPSNDCIPDNLWGLIKDRICKGKQIEIKCTKTTTERKKESKRVCDKWETTIWWTTSEAHTVGPNELTLPVNGVLDMEIPGIESEIFHELIHLAENYYGQQKYGRPGISDETYSYTCQAQLYNNNKCLNNTAGNKYPEFPCPPKFQSTCKECSGYKPPKPGGR